MQPRIRTTIEFLTTAVMIGASITLVWLRLADRQTDTPRSVDIPVPRAPLSLSGATILGHVGSPVAILMFSDYECVYCARFDAMVFPELRKDYVDVGRVVVAQWHFPRARSPNAVAAARAAECADRQGQFWAMHAALFVEPGTLDFQRIRQKAGVIGLDMTAFEACVEAPASMEAVTADIAFGSRLGIRGTPAFLIGDVEAGRVTVRTTISGTRPYSAFRSALDSALEQARR